MIQEPCPRCGGEGRSEKQVSLTVNIPAGVAEGQYIPRKGEGNVGRRGGPSGMCQVFIQEVEHDQFERHNNDVVYDLPVSFAQAALGAEIEVPTLGGKAKMKVPAGTQSSKIFRLRGKGIQDVNGYGRGDQLVRVVVWTPTKLNKEEQAIFRELSEHENGEPPEGGKGFFDRVKEVLTG